MHKASSVELRTSIEMAHSLAQIGIRFVPIPVETDEEASYALLRKVAVKNPPPFYRHSKTRQQKGHSREWPNCMYLLLKFGGPCWT